MLFTPHSKCMLLLASLWLLASCSGGTSFNIGGPDDDPDGVYDLYFDLSAASASGTECQSLIGSFEVTGATVAGTVAPDYSITGTFNADNSITGVILFASGEKLADYSGELVNDRFRGTWDDITGCTGSWEAYG